MRLYRCRHNNVNSEKINEGWVKESSDREKLKRFLLRRREGRRRKIMTPQSLDPGYKDIKLSNSSLTTA